jgi:hypothetical protein
VVSFGMLARPHKGENTKMFTFSTHPPGGVVIDRPFSLVKSLLLGWNFFLLSEGMLALDAEFHRALPLYIFKDARKYGAGKGAGVE